MFNTYVNLLRSDGSIIVNKKLARNLGLNEAVIYSELLSRYCYFKDRNILTTDGFFYNSAEDLERATTLSDYQQRKAIKLLVEKGLLLSELRNVPPIRHFKIITDTKVLLELLEASIDGNSLETKDLISQKLPVNFEENAKLISQKLQTNNTNINNTKNNTKENKSQNLFSTPSKKENKAKDIVTMKGMISAFTSSEELQDCLLEYFYIRLKKGLQPNQWKIILDDLKDFTKGNISLAVEKVKGSIAGGYMQIIPAWEKNRQQAFSRPSFDNTAGREVQSAKTVQEVLAKDEQGNLIKF